MTGATTIDELPKPVPDTPKLTSGSLARLKEPYNADLADQCVQFPAVLSDRHFWAALLAAFSFFINLLRLETSRRPRQEIERRQAELVKQLLIELGPTYIKLGQFLSVRRDLLPVTVADELATLQDRVPPFSPEQARSVILQELGALPEELFASFDPTPLASASIGQVHRVVLKNGSEAVLKVQRQGLARDFYRDLGILRFLARAGLGLDGWARKLKARLKTVERPARFDFANWLEMSDEFGKTLFAEIDYLVEGRNADRLRRLLRDRTEIRIPRVIWKYSSRKVLALEFIEGTKIDRVDELKHKGVDLESLGNLLISCYLEQIVIKGFFHADPHAGNLAVDREGRLVIYDFGMMGEISERQRRSLLNCVLATVNKDVNQLVRNLAELQVVRGGTNHDAVARALTPFMDYYAGRSLFDLNFQQLERDIDTVITERSLRLPANLAYILRTGSSLEGIARTLKSDFSFIQAVRPLVRKLVTLEGLEALSSLDGLLQLAGQAVTGLRRKEDSTNGKTASAKNKESNPEYVRQDSCAECRGRQVKERRIKRELTLVAILAAGYTAMSLGTIFMQEAGLPGRGDLHLILGIGNIIVGGIMTWKLIRLTRWH